jgi:uncharacterized membrane protein YedE/YeeE
LLLCNGDIIFLQPKLVTFDHSHTSKLVFYATMFTVSCLILPTGVYDNTRLETDPSIPIPSIVAYVIGGLLVGFGTKIGSGCTTGHGVCGMARFSKRSIIAVGTFMVFAIGTASLTSPTLEWMPFLTTSQETFQPRQLPWVGVLLTSLLVGWACFAIGYSVLQIPPAVEDEEPSGKLNVREVQDMSEDGAASQDEEAQEEVEVDKR